MLSKMIINNSEFKIIETLLEKDGQTLKELRTNTKKSRISIYHSLKKLESIGFIDKRGTLIKLQKNPLVGAFSNLITEGFPVGYLIGMRLSILIELICEADVETLSSKIGISAPSTRRYLKELSPLLTEVGSKYKINEKRKNLIEFLKLVKSQVEFQSGTIIIWKKRSEKLVKTKKTKVLEGALTSFSRFSKFGVEYKTIYNYYFLPGKEVSLEEILVHALCSAEDANMLSICIIFYLKNKEKIDIFKVEEFSKKFEVIDLWMDVIAYIENTKIKNKDMFLPKPEFLEKAGIYNTPLVSKYPKKNLFSIFDEISMQINLPDNEIKIYMIGGGALIQYAVKETTKDLDLIVENIESFETLKTALFDINFHELADVTPAYKNLCASTIMERKNSPRIDIFVKKVCAGIVLTQSMKGRASLMLEKNNLKLYILSPEDIFLFKAFSSREGDIIDCERIILKKKINWGVVLEEYEGQQKNMEGFSGLIILDHIEMLEKRTGITIPITKKLTRICLEAAILHILKTPKIIKEIEKEIGFKEYQIRNAVVRLIKQGKIKKIAGKPAKFTVIGDG